VRELSLEDNKVTVFFSHLETWVFKCRKQKWYFNGKHEEIKATGLQRKSNLSCQFAADAGCLDVRVVQRILQDEDGEKREKMLEE